MTSFNRRDADLHYPNGEHRLSAPSANGHDVTRFETRIRAHLEAHKVEEERAR